MYVFWRVRVCEALLVLGRISRSSSPKWARDSDLANAFIKIPSSRFSCSCSSLL